MLCFFLNKNSTIVEDVNFPVLFSSIVGTDVFGGDTGRKLPIIEVGPLR